jgi:hypothetical protein
MALRAQGHKDAAGAALGRALDVQRSDKSNLLLLARWQADDGEVTASIQTLAEVVEAWPEIVAAPGWQQMLPPQVTTETVVDQAVFRWQRGLKAPEPFLDQGLWLSAMSHRPDLYSAASNQSGFTASLAQATLDVFECIHPDESLSGLPPNDRRTYQYWRLRLRASSMHGLQDSKARDLVVEWGGGPLFPEIEQEYLNPLDDNGAGGFSADVWGYRRPIVEWPIGTTTLPSVQAGTAKWLLDPAGAAREAGLTDRLPACP